jgi:hypothetical protein
MAHLDEIDLDDIIDDIEKYKLTGLNTKKVKEIKTHILKRLTINTEELKHYQKLLNKYRFIDEVDEFRLGSYIRWFNIKKDIESIKLMRGGFIVDLKPTENDINILCKNGNNRFFYLKMNESIIFQKNTTQEQILIQILDHMKE